MKRYVALFVLMLVCLLPVAAQQREEGRPRFNMEEFQGWMKSFIRERACLTQAEADLVFPVFFEMKQKQGQYQRKQDRYQTLCHILISFFSFFEGLETGKMASAPWPGVIFIRKL